MDDLPIRDFQQQEEEEEVIGDIEDSIQSHLDEDLRDHEFDAMEVEEKEQEYIMENGSEIDAIEDDFTEKYEEEMKEDSVEDIEEGNMDEEEEDESTPNENHDYQQSGRKRRVRTSRKARRIPSTTYYEGLLWNEFYRNHLSNFKLTYLNNNIFHSINQHRSSKTGLCTRIQGNMLINLTDKDLELPQYDPSKLDKSQMDRWRLPSSELLKAMHDYANRYYYKFLKEQGFDMSMMNYALDGPSMMAIGMLVQEYARYRISQLKENSKYSTS